MGKRILCVGLPSWPVQRMRTELMDAQRGLPLVLFRRDARRGRSIVAACDRSQQLGARPKLALSVVDTLRQNSQQILVREHDPWLDRRSLEELAGRCTRELCPVVALEPLAKLPWADQLPHQPQALLMDIAGTDHLFGGEDGLLEHFQGTFNQWGWRVTLALSSASGLSWGMAHYGTHVGQNICIAAGDERATLISLPLEALRLPEKIVDTLHRLGIDSVGDLLPLPRDELIRRFDKILLDRMDQATGLLDEPLDPFEAIPPPVATANFDYPTKSYELIERCVTTLATEIAVNLKSCGQGALRVVCEVSLEDRPSQTLEVAFFAPTAEAKHLSEQLNEAIQRRGLRGLVKSIHIKADLQAPLTQRQPSLLPDAVTQTSDGSLARLVDQLSNRLGRDRVLGVSLEDDQQPELALRLFPLAGQVRKLRPKPGGKTKFLPTRSLGPTADEPLRRPLCLYPSPKSIEVQMDAEGDRPTRFQQQNCWFTVSRSWGPERIETGWWRGPSVRREYFRVETDDGRWWWIFRRLGDDRWFLHGRFD